MYTNVECLIKSRLTSLQPDIVAITEVFPKHCLNTIPQESLQITEYICTVVTFLQVEGCVCTTYKSSLKVTLYCKIHVKSKFDEALWF